MAVKEIKMGVWLTYGRMSGFGIGFTISRFYTNLDLGFWYIGLEYQWLVTNTNVRTIQRWSLSPEA